MSTRNRTDSFTAFRTLHEDRAPDGGMFVPFRCPSFSCEEIADITGRAFGDVVAHILNQFFSAGLTGWDVDFCAGRHPVKLVSMNHKLIIAELWRNHDAKYAFFEDSIYRRLCRDQITRNTPTLWAKIAIRVAVLFGVWSELSRIELDSTDICVPSDDFAVPMAAWYARKMGLPMGRIICTCLDNSVVWDFIHRGECNAVAAGSEMPNPVCLEMLIFETLGLQETLKYREKFNKKSTYTVDADKLTSLSEGFYASVVGSGRVDSLHSSIFRSCGYIADTGSALSFGGLQNYRAKTGSSQVTLLLSDQSPVYEEKKLQGLLGLSAEELRAKVNHS